MLLLSLFIYSCHFSLSGLPSKENYPATQIVGQQEVEGGPSVRRRRLAIGKKQFSLFFDTVTNDIYLQSHEGSLPLFVGFENTGRFNGFTFVDDAIASCSDQGSHAKRVVSF